MSSESPTLSALANLLDPPRIPSEEVYRALEFRPNPGKQTEFLDSTEFDVGYGGAAGGGKTKSLLITGLIACKRYPGIQVWAFRRSYPELQDSLLMELGRVAFAAALGAKWKADTRELVFDNGSVFRFRYCETIADASRYQSSEMQLLLLDERTLFMPDVVQFLYTRIRSSNPNIPVLGVRSGTNPGGVGHGAFKGRYILPTNYGQTTYTDEQGRTVRFIPARISDNPHLNPEYERHLDGIADEALRAALKDGNWDTFAGQYFRQWRHDRHVIDPFPVPSSWQRVAGIDWGYSNPHAVIWTAYADGRAWVYRELYGTEVGEREVARRILEAEGALTGDYRKVVPAEQVRRVGDPAMWGKIGDATPIAATMMNAGVAMYAATNDRLSGWQRFHTYLDEGPPCDIHRQRGWESCPRLHVFSNCVNLIRTLPELVHDPRRPEDVLKKGADDHAPDAARYALMALPVPSRGMEPRREPQTIEERIRERHQLRRKHNRSRVVGL